MRRIHCLTLLAAVCSAGAVPVPVHAASIEGQWTQWGGPSHDFKAPADTLATEWPESGPPVKWRRDLGEGYSSILVEGDRLYTMCREEDKEAVICLSANDGKTIWKYAYDSLPPEGHVNEFGKGPRATPLIVDDKIYSIGVSGVFHCLDKKDGAVHWKHDLLKDFGGSVLPHGYSSSPILYKDTVIALSGGDDQSIIAFNRHTGDVVWKKHSFKNSYSTPRVLDVMGEPQLITFMAAAVIALDPGTGDFKWSFDHTNQWGQNICMPTVVDDMVLISSPEAGARGLKLTRVGSAFSVEEVWSNRKIQFYHVTAVELGDYVYGSTGMRAPAFMAGINVKTGDIAWRKRGFAKANCLYGDGKVIILDEDGQLGLATVSPEDFTVHATTNILEKVTWTVPTLVGKTLYVRDKKEILALDLG